MSSSSSCAFLCSFSVSIFTHGWFISSSFRFDSLIARCLPVLIVVVAGATIQAHILSQLLEQGKADTKVLAHTLKTPILASPYDLGVEGLQGLMHVVLPKGTRAPASRTCVFSVSSLSPGGSALKIVEGSAAVVSGNVVLGELALPFTAAADDKKPKMVNVSFTLDASGQLTVVASLSGGFDTATLVLPAGKKGKAVPAAVATSAAKEAARGLAKLLSYASHAMSVLERGAVQVADKEKAQMTAACKAELTTWVSKNPLATTSADVFDTKLRELQSLCETCIAVQPAKAKSDEPAAKATSFAADDDLD